MPSYGAGPVSHLVAVRKVVFPSEELERFYGQLVVDARETLGYSGVQTVEVPETLNRQLDSDYQVHYEDVGKLNADIFALRSLRVVLFSRRAPASPEVNNLLDNAYARLKSSKFYAGRVRRTMTGRRKLAGSHNQIPAELKQIQLDNGFDNGNLAVAASCVENTSEQDAFEQLYSLKIDAGTAAAKVLIAQHEALESAASRIQAVKKLRRDEHFEGEVDPLDIKVLRFPGGLNRETERFEEVVNLHPAVHFELGPIEWRLKASSAND